MKHNALQSACHVWFWNTFPELRGLFHANFNNLSTETGDAARQMARLKSLGLVAGVLDYEFYYRGVLHVFDFKVGADSLKPAQLDYIHKIEEQGGRGYEIRSIEKFMAIILDILNN